MKYSVYNQKGEKMGTTILPEEVFEVKLNPDLVWQIVISQMARRRKNIAHTKDRGEVSGGGRKPWRQKGTGRARHGSIRSPIGRGGGITFGPRKDRVFKKRIPKKMQRLALFMSLSAKAENNLILILDKLEIERPKTKEISEIISKLKSKVKNFEKGTCLIVLPKYDKKFVLAARNIPQLEVMEARNLNPLDLLSSKFLMMPKESIKSIQETFFKK
jgi:large subunit ribosomal protein L4